MTFLSPSPLIPTEPRTILSPPLEKVLHLAPLGVSHPLYDRRNERNIDLRREIINDLVILPYVSPLDERLNEPKGLTFINYNNKPITFKRLPIGKLLIWFCLKLKILPTHYNCASFVLLTSVIYEKKVTA